MFQSARLKLTAWYLLIIMLISVLFSVVIYTVINREYSRIEDNQLLRQEREQQGFLYYFQQLPRQGTTIPFPRFQSTVDIELIEQARARLLTILALVNLGILGLAGVAGYFLAGRTLQPIKEIVDEQNRFITDASHELRTPLTSLKTTTEVYLRDKNHTLAEADRLHQSNLEEINNLQSLSDNLIKLTQYQKLNGNILFEDISLKEIVAEAEKKVAVLAKHKNITIDNQMNKVHLKADRQSFTELFVIFLDNAIKYSPKRTIITLNSEVADHHLIIKIIDQGIGIAKEDLPHLFERFYRADKSRTKAGVSGYGLGLSIAKQIINKHHGSISVSSELHKGTTFTIQLPLKPTKQ